MQVFLGLQGGLDTERCGAAIKRTSRDDVAGRGLREREGQRGNTRQLGDEDRDFSVASAITSWPPII
jgi:hypothetical protein